MLMYYPYILSSLNLIHLILGTSSYSLASWRLESVQQIDLRGLVSVASTSQTGASLNQIPNHKDRLLRMSRNTNS